MSFLEKLEKMIAWHINEAERRRHRDCCCYDAAWKHNKRCPLY